MGAAGGEDETVNENGLLSRWRKWRKRKRRLRALRRLSPQEFAEFARKIQPAFEASEKRRLESLVTPESPA